jgi:hypothetical protein
MRLTIRVALLVCALLAAATAQAYDNPQEYLEIPFIDVVPELDDFAEMKPAEHLEGKMALVTGFIQREPNNGGVPAFDTKVYVAYDRQRLYAVFVAFDDEPEKIRANMAPRDDVFNDDSVNIMIDTFNDQQRAYFFLSTPRGVQAEGQFIEGRGFDGSFDAVWDADGRLTDRGYIVRIAVPFVAIRFPRTDEQTWRVIFNRTIPRLSEDNFWPEYSREIEGRLNQTAIVTGIRDISPGRNIQLAPFVFARDFRLETEDPTGKTVDKDDEQSIGLDAKFVIKDALVLDLTVNPDFSQVEADLPQPTVNQRFEVFFPEQRPFFLENADAFRTPTNLFFSRRIVDPSAGIKLTGRQGRYGIGVLFADDQAPGKGLEPGDPLRDEHALVGVVRVSRDFSEQSRIGMMFTDRELDTSHNRVAAIDGRIKHNDNWVTEFQLAGSGTRTLEGEEQDGTSLNAVLNRRGLHLNTHTHYLYTSPGFQTDLGFLGGQQRPDSQDFHQDVGWRFRPTDSKVTEWGPNFFVGRVWDTDGRKLDSAVRASMDCNWPGGTRVVLRYSYNSVTLTPEEFPELSVRREFPQNNWTVGFDTRRFTRVGFGLDVQVGEQINLDPAPGDEQEVADFRLIRFDMLWRPVHPLQFNFRYLRTQLENQMNSNRIFTNDLGRVRANWQFTKELSLRVIADFERLDAEPGETSLTDSEQIVGDVLVRYLWNPWQALYVGYTTSNRDFEDDVTLLDVEDRGRQFFVKFSYLFQL